MLRRGMRQTCIFGSGPQIEQAFVVMRFDGFFHRLVKAHSPGGCGVAAMHQVPEIVRHVTASHDKHTIIAQDSKCFCQIEVFRRR